MKGGAKEENQPRTSSHLSGVSVSLIVLSNLLKGLYMSRNNRDRGQTLRHGNAEGDQLAQVVFTSTSTSEESTAQDQATPTTLEASPEDVNTAKEQLAKILERLLAGTDSDDELVRDVLRFGPLVKRVKLELAKLEKFKEDMDDPDLCNMAIRGLQQFIGESTMSLQKVAKKNPAIIAQAAEWSHKARISNELLENLKLNFNDLKMATDEFVTALKRCVEDGLFVNPTSNDQVNGRIPMSFWNVLYAPASGQAEVLSLFDALRDSKAGLEEARTQSQAERNKAAAGHVKPEEKIKAEATANNQKVVSFYELVTEHGLGRLAFIPLSYSEDQRPIGKVAITRRAGNSFFGVMATTTAAAEMIFRLKRPGRGGVKVEETWLDKRELDISFRDGRPDFSKIKFDPIRNSLERAFRESEEQNIAFADELSARKAILETPGATGIEQLIAGEIGPSPIHISDWVSDQKKPDRKSHLVLNIVGDGQNLTVSEATPGSLKSAPFLREFLGKSIPRADFLKNKRLWVIIAKAREAELGRSVKEFLTSRPNLKNLFEDKEAFQAFLEARPDEYFFNFKWRDDQEHKFINAVLRVSEEGKVEVVKTIGRFSEEIFRNLAAEPRKISDINGRIRTCLKAMARRHFGDVIPEVLADQTNKYESLVGTPPLPTE